MVLQAKAAKINHSFWAVNKTKIVATAAAIIIWLLIVAGETFDYATEIPIELISINREVVITSPPPGKAKVLVEGKGRFLFTFMLFREGSLRLNISQESGAHVIRPTETDVFLTGSSQNLTLRKLVWPDSISLQVDRLVTRDLPIHNKITLKPAAGYTIVGQTTMTPNIVKVRGPQSAVASLDSIPTQTLFIDDLKFPIEKKVPFAPLEERGIRLLTDDVVISADVQKLMEKPLSNIPVTVRYLPQHLDAIVIPSDLSLVVVGGVNVVYYITTKDIQAYIEYHKGLAALTEECPVIIEPIADVRFRDVKPDRFKVVLQHQRAD